jgi:hypothetical protein
MTVSYAAYTSMGLLLLDYKKMVVKSFVIFTSFLFLCLVISSLYGSVSYTNAAIEYLMIIPLVFFIFGARFRLSANECLYVSRFITLGIFVLSLINMIQNGFPFVIPYIHILPDVYGALYGLGGAKIVTVTAFFCVFMEVLSKKRSLWLVLALFNFIFPSYLIAVGVGFAALSIIFILKERKLLLLVFPVFLILFGYAYARIQGMNFSVMDEYGLHPKFLSYLTIMNMFTDNFFTAMFGTGIGQFSSTPALWSSDYLRDLSSHSITLLPGMFDSYYHDEYMSPLLRIFDGNTWALSSSLNKPYSSVSTILGEYGFVGLSVIFLLLYRSICFGNFRSESFCLIIFIFLLWFVDLWHDSPWFIFMMTLAVTYKERVLNENE